MFKLADNQRIGEYLRKLIKNRGISARQFGVLMLMEEKIPQTEEEIGKKSNLLSQKLKGTRAITIADLPVLSKLLNVSCEEILSAGECAVVFSGHLTNYNVAASHDRQVWEEYEGLAGDPILYTDEYDKTIVDYALDFQNYELIKFLFEKKYIWLVGAEENDCFRYNFGAGITIEKEPSPDEGFWYDAIMRARGTRRARMIGLAAKNGDIEMLRMLHARETADLYRDSLYASATNFEKDHTSEELVAAVSSAGKEVLEYFSDTFKLASVSEHCSSLYVFPYMDKLIFSLVKAKSPYAANVIRRACEHNKSVFENIKGMINETRKAIKDNYIGDITDYMLNDLTKVNIFENGREGFAKYYFLSIKKGIIANYISIDAKTEDEGLMALIDETNRLYQEINNINS